MTTVSWELFTNTFETALKFCMQYIYYNQGHKLFNDVSLPLTTLTFGYDFFSAGRCSKFILKKKCVAMTLYRIFHMPLLLGKL